MDVQDFSITRRHALAGAGVVAAAALAACSTYGKDDGAAQQPAAAAPQVSGDGSAPADAIASTADIPVGSGKIFDDVVITQPASGDFRGLSPVCPHQGCKVANIASGEIVCPCHGSKFALDGALIGGPARTGLTPVAITVQGDSIVLG